MAMIEAAEASGELEPGRALLEPTSGNTGIALALVAKLKGYPLTCVLPENATEERRAPAAAVRRGASSSRRAPRARTAPSGSRSSSPSASRARFMPFQYANEANPRAHYEGTGAEIAEALERVDVLVAGLGTGGTLMGAGERLRETFPDVVVAAAEPLPGDPVMGLRSLADGYVPPILDVSRLDRKLLVSNAESVAGVRALLDHEGIFGGRFRRRRRPRRAPAGRRARRGRRRLRPRRRRAGSTSPPTSGTQPTSRSRWSGPSGGDPGRAFRSARRARPRRGAERGVRITRRSRTASPSGTWPGVNAAASPYRFELRMEDPEVWFLEDEGYELAVVHSHVSSPPRPSRTDVENVGHWEGRPYVIYTLRTGELAAWRITDGSIASLPLNLSSQ